MQKKVWQAGSAPAVLDWEEELDRELEFFTDGMEEKIPVREEHWFGLAKKVDFEKDAAGEMFGSKSQLDILVGSLETMKENSFHATRELKKAFAVGIKDFDYSDEKIKEKLNDSTLSGDERDKLVEIAINYKKENFHYQSIDMLLNYQHQVAVLYNKLQIPLPIDPSSKDAQNYKRCSDLYDDLHSSVVELWDSIKKKDATDFDQFTNLLDMGKLGPPIAAFELAIKEVSDPAAVAGGGGAAAASPEAAAGADGGARPQETAPAAGGGAGPPEAAPVAPSPEVGGTGGPEKVARSTQLPSNEQFVDMAGSPDKIAEFKLLHETWEKKDEDTLEEFDARINPDIPMSLTERKHWIARTVECQFYKVATDVLLATQLRTGEMYKNKEKYAASYTACCNKALEILRCFREYEKEMWRYMDGVSPHPLNNIYDFYNQTKILRLCEEHERLCSVPAVETPAPAAEGAAEVPETGPAAPRPEEEAVPEKLPRISELPSNEEFGDVTIRNIDKAGSDQIIRTFKNARERINTAYENRELEYQSVIERISDEGNPERQKSFAQLLKSEFYLTASGVLLTVQERMKPLHDAYLNDREGMYTASYTACCKKAMEILIVLRTAESRMWDEMDSRASLQTINDFYNAGIIELLLREHVELCIVAPPAGAPLPSAPARPLPGDFIPGSPRPMEPTPAPLKPPAQPDDSSVDSFPEITNLTSLLPRSDQFGNIGGTTALPLGSGDAIDFFRLSLSFRINRRDAVRGELYRMNAADNDKMNSKRIELIKCEFYCKAFELFSELQLEMKEIYERYSGTPSEDIKKEYRKLCEEALLLLQKFRDMEQKMWKYQKYKPNLLTKVELVYDYGIVSPYVENILKITGKKAPSPGQPRPPPADGPLPDPSPGPPKPAQPEAGSPADDPDATMDMDIDEEEEDTSESVGPSVDLSKKNSLMPQIETLLTALFYDDTKFKDPSTDLSDFFYKEVLRAMYVSVFVHHPNHVPGLEFGRYINKELNAEKERKISDTESKVKKSGFLQTDFFIHFLDKEYDFVFLDIFNSIMFFNLVKDFLKEHRLPEKNVIELSETGQLDALRRSFASNLEYLIAKILDEPFNINFFGLTNRPDPSKPSIFFEEVVNLTSVILNAYTQYRQGAIFVPASNNVKWISEKRPLVIEDSDSYISLDMVFPSDKSTQGLLAQLIYTLFFRSDVVRAFRISSEDSSEKPFSNTLECVRILAEFQYYTCQEATNSTETDGDIMWVLHDVNQCMREEVRDFVAETTSSYPDTQRNLQQIDDFSEMACETGFYDALQHALPTIRKVFKIIADTGASDSWFEQSSMHRSKSQILSLIKKLLVDHISDKDKFIAFKECFKENTLALGRLLYFLDGGIVSQLFRPTQLSTLRLPLYLHLMEKVMPAMVNVMANPELDVVRKYTMDMDYKILQQFKLMFKEESVGCDAFRKRLHNIGIFYELSSDETLVYLCKVLLRIKKGLGNSGNPIAKLKVGILQIKDHEFQKSLVSDLDHEAVVSIMMSESWRGHIFGKAMTIFQNLPDSELASNQKFFGTDVEVTSDMFKQARENYSKKIFVFDISHENLRNLDLFLSGIFVTAVMSHIYDNVELDFMLGVKEVDSNAVSSARQKFYGFLKSICTDWKTISTIDQFPDWAVVFYCVELAYKDFCNSFEIIDEMIQIFKSTISVPDVANPGVTISKILSEVIQESSDATVVDIIADFRTDGMDLLFNHLQYTLVQSQRILEREIRDYCSDMENSKRGILGQFKQLADELKTLEKGVAADNEMVIDYLGLFRFYPVVENSFPVQLANRRIDSHCKAMNENVLACKSSYKTAFEAYQAFVSRNSKLLVSIDIGEKLRALHCVMNGHLAGVDLSWKNLDSFLNENGINMSDLNEKAYITSHTVPSTHVIRLKFESMLLTFDHPGEQRGWTRVLRVFLSQFMLPHEKSYVEGVFSNLKRVLFSAEGEKDFFFPDSPTEQSDKALLLFICCAALPGFLTTDPAPSDGAFVSSDLLFRQLILAKDPLFKYVTDHDNFKIQRSAGSAPENLEFSEILDKLSAQRKEQTKKAVADKAFVLNPNFDKTNDDFLNNFVFDAKLLRGGDTSQVEFIVGILKSMWQTQLNDDVFSDSMQPVLGRLLLLVRFGMLMSTVYLGFYQNLPELQNKMEKLQAELEEKQVEIESLYNIIKDGNVVRVKVSAAGSDSDSELGSDSDSESDAGGGPGVAPGVSPAAAGGPGAAAAAAGGPGAAAAAAGGPGAAPAAGGGPGVAPGVSPAAAGGPGAAPAAGGGPGVAPGAAPAAAGGPGAAPAAGGGVPAAGPTVEEMKALSDAKAELERQLALTKASRKKHIEAEGKYKAEKEAFETANDKLKKEYDALEKSKTHVEINAGRLKTDNMKMQKEIKELKSEKARTDTHVRDLKLWGKEMRRTAQEQYKVYQKVTEFFGGVYDFGEPASKQTLAAEPSRP